MLDWFANNLMQANPDKFQALAIGKKTFKEQICFDLNGSKIKCEEHVKLLGVTIDYELNFDQHISEICKKSAKNNFFKKVNTFLKDHGIGIPMIAGDFNETLKEIDRRSNSSKTKYQTVNSLKTLSGENSIVINDNSLGTEKTNHKLVELIIF